jgi:uncharacterized coiled-coil protein SlyX
LKDYDTVSTERTIDGVARVVAEVRKEFDLKFAALECLYEKKIAELEAQIAAGTQPMAWKIDPPRYRAVPFYGGKPGKPLDVRPFFQQFFNELQQSFYETQG